VADTPAFDWTAPDYTAVVRARADRLEDLRADASLVELARLHYTHAPWDFIGDWGWTFDPRKIEAGEPSTMPFVLWPRQEDFVRWVMSRWLAGGRGLCEKSRDCGVTWLAVGFAVSMWLFRPGFAAGFGSRKEDLVDKRGDPDCIFEKVRFFIRHVPDVFMPARFNWSKHSAHMRVVNPANGATITGEGGENIGRGGRKSVYFVDEAAHIEHQKTVDAALSQTTNCQIDVSSVNGNGNEFARKRQRFDGTERVFVFDWTEDPRKDQAWFQAQCDELTEEIVAQEILRDYDASQVDAFIPARWVAAAMDAHKVLGFEPVGVRVAGFDPADVGDGKAVILRHGSVLLGAEELKHGDIADALPWAFNLADEFRADVLAYDGDGMGAPVMKTALAHRAAGRMRIVAYHGSAGVVDPRERYGEGRRAAKRRERRIAELHAPDATAKTNADTFKNFRAQSWTWARDRFEATYNAVTAAREGRLVNADPEDLVSIDSTATEARQLQSEISRPKRVHDKNGLIKVESKPEMKARGVASPNLADGAIIALSVRAPTEAITRPRTRVREQGVNDATVGY